MALPSLPDADPDEIVPDGHGAGERGLHASFPLVVGDLPGVARPDVGEHHLTDIRIRGDAPDVLRGGVRLNHVLDQCGTRSLSVDVDVDHLVDEDPTSSSTR